MRSDEILHFCVFYCIPSDSFYDCIIPALMIGFFIFKFSSKCFILFGLMLQSRLLSTWGPLPQPHTKKKVFHFHALSLAAITVIKKHFENSFVLFCFKEPLILFKKSSWGRNYGVLFEQGFCQKACLDGGSAAVLSGSTTPPCRAAQSQVIQLRWCRFCSIQGLTIGDVGSYKGLGRMQICINQDVFTWNNFNLDFFSYLESFQLWSQL